MTRTCGAVISSLRRVSLPVAMWVSSSQLMGNSDLIRVSAAQGSAAMLHDYKSWKMKQNKK